MSRICLVHEITTLMTGHLSHHRPFPSLLLISFSQTQTELTCNNERADREDQGATPTKVPDLSKVFQLNVSTILAQLFRLLWLYTTVLVRMLFF